MVYYSNIKEPQDSIDNYFGPCTIGTQWEGSASNRKLEADVDQIKKITAPVKSRSSNTIPPSQPD